MERVNRNCTVCNMTVAVPVDVHFMMATNLAEARNHGATAYCQKCDASYCFDHIVWKPARISETSETMTNVPLCPRCGGIMSGLPSEEAKTSKKAWPGLPDSGYFRGKAATMEDMTEGRAYFVIEKEGEIIGRPIPIEIPQYAYFLDPQKHRKVPSIILQAEEEPGGSKIVAFKDLEQGKERLAHFEQFVLLGNLVSP